MKERPILFSTDMVKAILEGRKTQTRRVIKHPERLQGLMMEDEAGDWCPYGQVGDRLWVRETWSPWADKETQFYAGGKEEKCLYKADYIDAKELPLEIGGVEHWKPSIFMPRWASRILLEITDIRVERLQEITEEDAIAEGSPAGYILASPTIFNPTTKTPKDYRGGFQRLWDTINGKKYPWFSNPWVWVISFKRIN